MVLTVHCFETNCAYSTNASTLDIPLETVYFEGHGPLKVCDAHWQYIHAFYDRTPRGRFIW